MHTSRELRSDHFAFTVSGQPAGFADVFPGFTEHDRLGVVIASDYGAAGASTVILAAVTAFYDRLRATGQDFFAYPDFFAFHVGQSRGSLRKLDIYPAHKEVVVVEDPQRMLEAINDRAITRLLLEASPARPDSEHELRPEARDSALRRVRTALEYSPTGRVAGGDVVVTGSDRTEACVEAMLAGAGAGGGGGGASTARMRSHRTTARAGGDRPVESFRRLSADLALRALTAVTAGNRGH